VTSIDRTASPQTVSSLLDAIEKETLAIPEFQRDFVWTPSQIAELLRTVARDWPCGTFLMQESPRDQFACRAVDGAPTLRRTPSLVVLDGQQRLTALYHAVREKGDETYYITMREALAADELEDDHVQYKKTQRFRSLYPDLATEARSGVARIATLARDDEFFRWVAFLEESERPKAIKFRATSLPGLKHYSIPCVVLPRDTPLEAVAKIFETINRTGVRLDVFDLMVAKLHPHNFPLRDRDRDAIAEHPSLDEYDVAGLELLRLIALREHLRQTEARSKGHSVAIKGIRRSDVIQLSAEVVAKDWAAAVKDSAAALRFLAIQCGVASPALLPSRSMLLPVAANIASARTPKQKNLLQKWFWNSCASQTHAQGANTQVVADAKRIRSALTAGSWETDVQGAREALSAISEPRKRNEILLRGVCCALVMRGALEPRTGAPLAEVSEPLDIVPLFRARSAPSSLSREIESIANHIIVSASTRRRMGNGSPSELVQSGVLTKAGLQSQLVSWAALQRDDLAKHVDVRGDLLRTLCGELMGEDTP